MKNKILLFTFLLLCFGSCLYCTCVSQAASQKITKLKEKIIEVRNTLTSKADLQKELPNLMRILVERVEVEKINGDRKHVRLIIYFNFNADTIYIELEIDNKRVFFW